MAEDDNESPQRLKPCYLQRPAFRKMNSHQLLELIEPTESMVHQILEWRNNPEIRRWMVNTDEISKDDHLKWWSNTKIDPEKYLFICQDRDKTQGIVTFDRIQKNRLRWGFYKIPTAPKGIGFRLGMSAMNYAFSNLNATSVIGEVAPTNDRSLALHRRLGFEYIKDNQSRTNQIETKTLLNILVLTKKRWMTHQ